MKNFSLFHRIVEKKSVKLHDDLNSDLTENSIAQEIFVKLHYDVIWQKILLLYIQIVEEKICQITWKCDFTEDSSS